MSRSFQIDVAGDTHVGRVRHQNEDFFDIAQRVDLLLVADGVLSRPGGDVAAELAVDTVRDLFDHPEATWPIAAEAELAEGGERLVAGIALANHRVRARAQQLPHLEGMATTVAAALAIRGHIWIAHVGDSRVYRLREQRLELLTADHCVGSDPLASTWFTSTEISRTAPGSLSRALGLRDDVRPEVRLEELHAGDIFLLATRGVTNVVKDMEIAAALQEHQEAAAAVAALVERANDLGGPDNITAVVMRVE